MIFKSIKRSTYERNKKAGKFEVVSESETGATVIPHQTRGNYCNMENKDHITVRYEFTISLEEVKEQERRQHEEMMARIRRNK